ncbi:MAG: hypothetical protein DLD55_03180 [candidate division SR1 bacterium]|nr:MAG: hypothetical protein DLD55_03180 [candidate division SR1 bacterium]
MRQNINESAEGNKDLDQLFSLLQSFYSSDSQFKSLLLNQKLRKDLEDFLHGKTGSLTSEELKSLFELFSPGFELFYLLNAQTGKISLNQCQFFYFIQEKITLIPDILDKRNLVHLLQTTTNNKILFLLGRKKEALKSAFAKKGLEVKAEIFGNDKKLFLVRTASDQYCFINLFPKKDEKEIFAYGGELLKNYSFGKNKIYKFTRKTPRILEEIDNKLKSYFNRNPEATFGDFLEAILSEKLFNKIQKTESSLPFKVPLRGLQAAEIKMVFSSLNISRIQEEKEVLFLENVAHELSFMGEWKNITPPQKAEKGFHGQEAVVFNVEKLDGEKGILVTNSNQTEYFPL